MKPNKKEMKIAAEEDIFHALKAMASKIFLISKNIITSNILTTIFCWCENITFLQHLNLCKQPFSASCYSKKFQLEYVGLSILKRLFTDITNITNCYIKEIFSASFTDTLNTSFSIY